MIIVSSGGHLRAVYETLLVAKAISEGYCILFVAWICGQSHNVILFVRRNREP